MNVHASYATAINPALFAAPVVRRRIWSDRSGQLVNVPAVTVVAQKASVNWEAYVVDIETNQEVSQYPHVKETNVFATSNGARPTAEVAHQYLANVRGKVPQDAYEELERNINSQTWSIATIIHSTTPLEV